jgi:NitT/TauT family transport system substrate-binding protein
VETANITVGYLGGLGAAPFLLGIKQNLFSQNGLNITPKPFNSDKDEEAALKSGDIQIALGDYTVFLDNQQSPVATAVQVVGEAYSAGSNTIGLIAKSKSAVSTQTAITVAHDIAGGTTTVSVPSADSPEYVALAAWAMTEQAPMATKLSSVSTIETDLSTADAAKQITNNVASGADQTGVLQEPYLTEALETGKVVEVANLAAGTAADMPVSGYFALTKFTQTNPNTITAFDGALAQAQSLGGTRVNIEQALTTQSVSPALAATTNIGNFPTAVVPATIDNVLSLMNGAGLQTGALSSGTLTTTGTTVNALS